MTQQPNAQPSVPFADFAPRTPLSNPLRAAITAAYRRPEPEALAPLLAQARLPADQAAAAEQLALRIAKALRERKASAGRAGIVQGLYATSPVLEAKEFTTGKPFLEKYIAAFKKPPAYGGHYSYDSTYVLSAAIQKAKSADPKDITKALHSINGYAPVIGTMTWDDKGEQRYGAVGVYELRSGNWELRMRSDRW